MGFKFRDRVVQERKILKIKYNNNWKFDNYK